MAARIAWQPSLFGAGPVRPDHTFGTLRRIRLDDRSWVDYAPGWLSGADVLLEFLLRRAAWRQRERWMYDRRVAEPRLTAGFAVGGPVDVDRPDAGADADPAGLPPPSAVTREQVGDLVPGGEAGLPPTGLPTAIATICDLLGERYGVDFDSVWINLYRDGADGVAWHGDRNRHALEDPLVVTVSLGARRRFLLRPRGGRVAHTLNPGQGDLVVMGGACQHDWEHCVPKTARPVMPRIAVTIRHSH